MGENKLLINGELVNSSGGKTVDDIGPASGEPIAQVPESTVEDVNRAVAAAREAFDDGRWSDLAHGALAATLDKLTSLLYAHTAELAELVAHRTGNPMNTARHSYRPLHIDNIHFVAG